MNHRVFHSGLWERGLFLASCELQASFSDSFGWCISLPSVLALCAALCPGTLASSQVRVPAGSLLSPCRDWGPGASHSGIAVLHCQVSSVSKPSSVPVVRFSLTQMWFLPPARRSVWPGTRQAHWMPPASASPSRAWCSPGTQGFSSQTPTRG